MLTGGVEPSEENLISWFKAGVHCVGMGCKLFVKKADGSIDYEGLSTKDKETLALVQKLKN